MQLCPSTVISLPSGSDAQVDEYDKDDEDNNNDDDEDNGMAVKDLLVEVELWCKDIEARLKSSGVSHKVDADIWTIDCEKAAQIESNEAYLKRKALRYQRLACSVSAKKSPPSMLSYYCEHMVGNVVNGDIDNLSHYMEYKEDKIYPSTKLL